MHENYAQFQSTLAMLDLDTEVIEYEKWLTPQQPIGFDLLVNGLAARPKRSGRLTAYMTTAISRELTAATTTARVTDGAALVAAKLHSGRATDLRNVLAVTEKINLNTVTSHLRRGDADALWDCLDPN